MIHNSSDAVEFRLCGFGNNMIFCQVKVRLRLTVSQPVSLGVEPHIYYSLAVMVLFLWGALSDEKTGLSSVYAAGPRQRSLSWVRVPWHS
jgi:hypothetical protein